MRPHKKPLRCLPPPRGGGVAGKHSSHQGQHCRDAPGKGVEFEVSVLGRRPVIRVIACGRADISISTAGCPRPLSWTDFMPALSHGGDTAVHVFMSMRSTSWVTTDQIAGRTKQCCALCCRSITPMARSSCTAIQSAAGGTVSKHPSLARRDCARRSCAAVCECAAGRSESCSCRTASSAPRDLVSFQVPLPVLSMRQRVVSPHSC